MRTRPRLTTNIFRRINNVKIKVTEEIWKEGNMYVSYCPELDMASCGESVEESKKNLKEVISINFTECREKGALNRLLQDAGFTEDQDNVLLARKELVSFSPLEVGI
jgi:predicted RNase H-like HicB family nuclease